MEITLANNEKNTENATLEEHQKALYNLLEEFDRVCKILDISYFLFAGTLLGAIRHQGFIPWDDDLDILMMREDYEYFLKNANDYLNMEKFYLQKEFSEHWPMFFSKLRLNGTACLEKYHPKDIKTHQGIYIDIFPCDNAFDNRLCRKMQFYISKIVISKALAQRGYETDCFLKKVALKGCNLLPNPPFLRFTKLIGKSNSRYVHTFLAASSKYGKCIFPREWFDKTINIDFEGGKYPVPKDYDKILTRLYGNYMKLPSEEERKYKVHAILVDVNHSYKIYEHYRDNMKFTEFTRSIR